MNGRLRFLVALLGLWACLVGARLYELQVESHSDYRRQAARQQQEVIELRPPRGTIFDAGGRPLAVSVTADSVYAQPHLLQDGEAAARALAPVVGVKAEVLRRRFTGGKRFVWVARQVDQPVAEAVRRLGLEGVGFVPEAKRYYPQRRLAAQVLGFVGVDGQGLEGLEAQYEGVLAGTAATRKVLQDARRRTILAPGLPFQEAAPGGDVHLSLDSSLQHVVERELEAAVERHGARAGSVLLLEPGSGAVLAMASWPSFDPNRFQAAPKEHWRNLNVAHAYEPGSTFKLITAAAALEANLADPQDIFDCEMGRIVLEGVPIKDHHPFGELTFREVIVRSSNVGAIKTGLLVGPGRLYRQIRAFGFGRRTGIDLPGESAGIVRPVERWQKRSVAYISFGQEIAVTPLQLTAAFAAIANGGVLQRPYVVAAIDDGGRLTHRKPRPVARPIGAATARSLERMLEAVVDEGTGRKAAIAGYRVGGKTGTAQKAVPGIGYLSNRYVASFVGFAPARRPAVVGLVVIDEPTAGAYHGGDVAADVFAAIVEQSLVVLGVAPGPSDPQEGRQVASRQGEAGAARLRALAPS